MPHVKGNKFKPKLPDAPEPAAARPAAVAAPLGELQPGGQKKKKNKKQRQQARGDVAVEPATAAAVEPAAAAAAADGTDPPPTKKQRRQQQAQARQQQAAAQQPQLPAIPTVVAPAPKPGVTPAEAAAAAATSNWAAMRAAMDVAKQQQAASKPHWQKKRKAAEGGAAPPAGGGVQPAVPANQPKSLGSDMAPTKVVAMDCEMVGVGPGGTRSVLARCAPMSASADDADQVLMDGHSAELWLGPFLHSSTALNIAGWAPCCAGMQGVPGEQRGQCAAGPLCEAPGEGHRLPHQSQR